MTHRILITGSRDFTDRDVIEYAIRSAATGPGVATVVVGGCRGADSIAADVAAQLGLDVETHDADWATHGRAAGPVRNSEMVDAGADICLAFPLPGSVGTWDCVRKAQAAGILTVIRQQEQVPVEAERFGWFE